MDDLDDRSTAPASASRRRSRAGFPAGTVIAGRYRIESYLAKGGMGQVYHAHDLDLDVPVAVKTIRPKVASDPAAVRRLKEEVLLARSVSHPNVCRIFDLGCDGETGTWFLTMELLPGETLASRIASRGAFPSETALPLVRQMADALDAAHRAGIVHRDFKSLNVMLVPRAGGEERAVITDFGLAMVRERRAEEVAAGIAPTSTAAAGAALDAAPVKQTGRHALDGTPAYMSPEQVAGGAVGPASDLYAFGVVLFEMCTGQLPFRGATPWETACAHVLVPPPSPSRLARVDDTWEQTILRLLSKDAEGRFESASDAVLALEGRLDGDLATIGHSLPAERDAFVGRAAELEALISFLEHPGGPGGSTGCGGATRLLTLHGPGGAGKTRLAQRYGWERLSHWPGGVWFCDLSEARSVDGIADAVATALKVALGKGDPIVQLGHAIAGRGRCLVILDNFEQVASHAEATLARWLQQAAQARFLVTSRERLHLPEESLHEIGPLDPSTHGAELFELRARAHRPGFQVDASSRGQVEQIVARLDGLPLAIELATSRLRVLGLAQLHERLEHRLGVLSGARRGRHGTLVATLDWSWDLLLPWERSTIAQLSVFEGGFTLESAEAVIDLAPHPEAPPVLDVIQSLVDRSWLRTSVALAAPRFSMYATIQDYASAKLRAGFAEDAGGAGALVDHPSQVETRHGAYFAPMGTCESIDRLNGPGGVKRLAALELELENMVAACRRAIARGDGAAAVAAYAAASAVIALRGPFAVSIRLGLDVLGVLGDRAERGYALLVLAGVERSSGKMEPALVHYEEALAILRELGSRDLEGVALRGLGQLHHEQGRMEEARTHYETALAIHRELGNRHAEGIVIGDLGELHHDQGRVEEARRHYEAALGIHREMGNRRAEGVVIGDLGKLHHEQGRMEEARASYEAALAIHREVGNRSPEGVVLGNLGSLHRQIGRLEEAREYYRASLLIHREIGKRGNEGLVLGNLGNVHNEQGRIEEAREHYEAALAIHREVGNRRLEGIVLGSLASTHHGQGRLEEAREHYEAALGIHRDVGNRRFEGVVLGNLANVCSGQGRMEEARAFGEASLAIHRELGDRRSEGVVLGNLGFMYARQGKLEEAREHYEAALAIHRDLGTRRYEGGVLGNLGDVRARQGRLEDARALYEAAVTIHRELKNRVSEGVVLGQLANVCFLQGQVQEARAVYEAALIIHREVGNRPAEGMVLADLGRLHSALGCIEEARRCFQEGLSILRAADEREWLGNALCAFADCELRDGQRARARAALAEAESVAREMAVTPEWELARRIAELRRSMEGGR